MSLTRRTMLKTTAGAVVGAAAIGANVPKAKAATDAELKIPANADFYDADGVFDVEKGKDAVIALCEYNGYPVFDGFRDGLWVSDYATGVFRELGLAAFMYHNNPEGEYSYMVMDLFLMPGQMLPEHWHLSGEGNQAKNEGWLIRWGQSHVVGIGEPNLTSDIVIPKCHCDGTVETKHQTIATPGTFVPLAEVGSKHWQYGGPEGAIITEVANCHTDSAVRHADPALNKFFLGE
jgi:D-lyxose ketol-isomerase